MNLDLVIILALFVVAFLLSLVVERLSELFDRLVVLNLFPWWRSAPTPPLIKIPPKPHEQDGDGYPKGILTASNTALATQSDDEDNVDEVELGDETEFVEPLIAYRRRLIYYIIKYGYFLSEKGLLQRLINWALDTRNAYPYSLLEVLLARREGVALLPGTERDEKFVKKLINDEDFAKKLLGPLSVEQKSSEANLEIALITKLQLWADYCYLRNQRTYNAFSSLKGQVYLFFGTILGIVIVNLLTWAFTSENLLAWASPQSSILITQQPSQPANNWVRWILGGGSGALSPVTHGFTRRIANAGLRRVRFIR